MGELLATNSDMREWRNESLPKGKQISALISRWGRRGGKSSTTTTPWRSRHIRKSRIFWCTHNWSARCGNIRGIHFEWGDFLVDFLNYSLEGDINIIVLPRTCFDEKQPLLSGKGLTFFRRDLRAHDKDSWNTKKIRNEMRWTSASWVEVMSLEKEQLDEIYCRIPLHPPLLAFQFLFAFAILTRARFSSLMTVWHIVQGSLQKKEGITREGCRFEFIAFSPDSSITPFLFPWSFTA